MTPALFFFVLSIGLFCWVLFLKLHLRIERDRIEAFKLEITSMKHQNHMLKNKIQKKKELLEIQDVLLKENNIKHYGTLEKNTHV